MPYYIGDVIQDQNKLIARTPEKFRESGIDVQISARVEGIDPARGEVSLQDGRIFPYDVLVMATGTSAFVPDMPGLDLPGVVSLRSLEDAVRIKT
ncbi:MAG: FAD-dependent oxidoreductase, partial [Smithellaceae bacterium]